MPWHGSKHLEQPGPRHAPEWYDQIGEATVLTEGVRLLIPCEGGPSVSRLERFPPRIDDAAAFARVNRVLLLRTSSGVGLDIALGGLPFEETAVDRSTLFTFPPDVALRTCSAEDLLVLKAFADRPKDWVDIDGIIIRQAGGLDWDYVRRQLAPLAELKDAPGLLGRLDQRRVDLDR